ncbi:MAG: hypothetical protein GY722_10345 [bacterium]|nr:hypothetical protein [bacterium]
MVSAGIDALANGFFSYEATWRNPAFGLLYAEVNGLHDGPNRFISESWLEHGAFGVKVVAGVEFFGRPDIPLGFPGADYTAPWDWIEVPAGFSGLVPASHPDPAGMPFRYMEALTRIVTESESERSLGSSSMSTTSGIVDVDRYELIVPAPALAATVGNGSEAQTISTPTRDLAATVAVTISLDSEGRLRELEYESQELARLYGETFGATADEGAYKFRLVIHEYDPALALGWLWGVPEQARILDVDEYLAGEERLGADLCVWSRAEMGWPALGDSEPCDDENAAKVIGSVIATVDGPYPGYDSLEAYAAELCRNLAEEELGEAVLGEDYAEFFHSYPSLSAWEYGDRTIMCGIQKGRY